MTVVLRFPSTSVLLAQEMRSFLPWARRRLLRGRRQRRATCFAALPVPAPAVGWPHRPLDLQHSLFGPTPSDGRAGRRANAALPWPWPRSRRMHWVRARAVRVASVAGRGNGAAGHTSWPPGVGRARPDAHRWRPRPRWGVVARRRAVTAVPDNGLQGPGDSTQCPGGSRRSTRTGHGRLPALTTLGPQPRDVTRTGGPAAGWSPPCGSPAAPPWCG
jgi:hypothetical protein